jgi:hypothetical protein
MGKPGRPRKEIDLTEAEKLCALQCTAQEIADWFHVSVDTLDKRIREQRGVGFSDFFATHRTNGKIALRRMMFKLAQQNATMCIFLAKNHLGMVDKLETDVTTKGESINAPEITVKLAGEAVSILRNAGAVRAIRAGAVSEN